MKRNKEFSHTLLSHGLVSTCFLVSYQPLHMIGITELIGLEKYPTNDDSLGISCRSQPASLLLSFLQYHLLTNINQQHHATKGFVFDY
jgi:hypothetical protein